MKRIIIFVTLLLGIAGCAKDNAVPASESPEPTATAAETDSESTNAVDVDSDSHKVELENSLVRIVRYEASPGYRSNLHTHIGGAYVSLTNAKSRTTLENGETVGARARSATPVPTSRDGPSAASTVTSAPTTSPSTAANAASRWI